MYPCRVLKQTCLSQLNRLEESVIVAANAPDQNRPASTLQDELRRVALLGFGTLFAAGLLVMLLSGAKLTLAWLLPALACWSVVLWRCRLQLHLNCDLSGQTHYSSLGHGNQLTLLRGFLISATAGFLTISQQLDAVLHAYIPAVLYTAAAIGDALDGYLARRQQQITQLGAELDNELDALGLVIAPLLAVLTDKLHASYLLVSIAYYVFHAGLIWRRKHNKPVFPLPPSRLRRQLAGWQMGLVATCLWPPVPGEISRVVGVLFMIPLLLGFARDWLYVSGRRTAAPAVEPG